MTFDSFRRRIEWCAFAHRTSPRQVTFAVGVACIMWSASAADEKISLPILWVGIEGAPSVEDPGIVGEGSTDNVFWRRHERPTDAIYLPMAEVSFRSAATKEIKNGPVSFPIIRDPFGSGGDVLSTDEMDDAIYLAKRAWAVGDPLYYDANNSGVVDGGLDSLLSTNTVDLGFVELGHDGAMLLNAPNDVRFVDGNSSGSYDIGETLYRDENSDGFVDEEDTLLSALTTVVGSYAFSQLDEPLLNVPAQVKFLDLIREPANTFHIGNPAIKGIVAVSANDFNSEQTDFPTHGSADYVGGTAAVLDDPSQYLPPGPNYKFFETQLVGHEFGHVLGLPHGDTPGGGGPAAQFPDGGMGGPGTLCDSDNMMQYCWIDGGEPGDPDLVWDGQGPPSSGVITAAQRDVIRGNAQGFLESMGMGMLAGDGLPQKLVATRIDTIGEVPEAFGFVDIADFGVTVDGETTQLNLLTRRPLRTFNQATRAQYVFALDVDGDPTSGGEPAAIPGENILSDFDGAEFVVAIELVPSGPLKVKLFEHVDDDSFVLVNDPGIFASRETIEASIDFVPETPIDLRLFEQFLVTLPNDLLTPFASRFRVEYLAAADELGIPLFADTALAEAMNFDVVSYPECVLDKETYQRGEGATVTAGELLPDSHAHLFLGDMQVGEGITDEDGNITIEFTIPPDSAFGDRLVTVGTLAVTADCFLRVVPEPDIVILLAIGLTAAWSRARRHDE